MHARILMLILSATFAVASSSEAATVDIYLVKTPRPSTNWNLLVRSPFGIGAIALLTSSSLATFTPDPIFAGPPPICALGLNGCELQPTPVPGFNLLTLAFVPDLFSGGSEVLLGNFTAAFKFGGEIVGADDVAGYTVTNPTGVRIADYAIHIIPEPSELWLFAALVLSCAVAASRPSSSQPG